VKDKSKVIQQLEDALGIKPQDIEDNHVVEYTKTSSNQYEEDYEFTKETQKELYKLGFSSLQELTDLARETSDVKYFQTIAALLKSMNDVSNSVVDAAKTKSDIEVNNAKAGTQKENIINGTITQTNQTIYIGSTKDLSKFLEDNRATVDTIEDIIINNDPSN